MERGTLSVDTPNDLERVIEAMADDELRVTYEN
jgi:hypothetical protein